MMTLPRPALENHRSSGENRRTKRTSRFEDSEERYGGYRPSAYGDSNSTRAGRNQREPSPMGIGASAERLSSKLLDGRRSKTITDTISHPLSPKNPGTKYSTYSSLLNYRYDMDVDFSRRRGSSPGSASSASSSGESAVASSSSLPRRGRRPLPHGPGPLLPSKDSGFRRRFSDTVTPASVPSRGPVKATQHISSLETQGRYGSRSRFRSDKEYSPERTVLSRRRSQSLSNVKQGASTFVRNTPERISSSSLSQGNRKATVLTRSPSLDILDISRRNNKIDASAHRLANLSLYSNPTRHRSPSPVAMVDSISNGKPYTNSLTSISDKDLANNNYSISPISKDDRKDHSSVSSLLISSHPFEKDEKVYISENSKISSVTDGLVGFSNLGNTCFMNCIVQCLRNILCLRDIFVGDEIRHELNNSSSPSKGKIAKSFAEVVKESWNPAKIPFTVLSLGKLKFEVQQYAPRFSGYDQQDSQEFLRFLLEGLHEDLNLVKTKPNHTEAPNSDHLSDSEKGRLAWEQYQEKERSRITNLFVGQLKSTLICSFCQYTSVAFDPFWDLSLPIPTTGKSDAETINLTDCFDVFTQEETLDGEEQPTCEQCQKRRKCTKKFSIDRFPPILVIHLKRFSGLRYRTKLSRLVNFPFTLPLARYASTNAKDIKYSLASVCNHMGSTFSGHYTAFCRHPDSSIWYSYNDARVNKIPQNDIVTSSAYVVFYELDSSKSSS